MHGSSFIETALTAANPDKGKIKEAIRAFVPNGDITLTAINPMGGEPVSRTFTTPDQLNDAAKWADGKNKIGANIYWAPNFSPKRNAKVKADDVTLGRYLWADIDPKISDFSSYAAARADLVGRMLPRLKQGASVVIDSGNGLQVLLKLVNPIDLTVPKYRKRYNDTNEEIGTMLEGPGTHNADRILRLPGTLNYPNPAKLKKGYPSEPSLSCLLHVSGSVYQLDLSGEPSEEINTDGKSTPDANTLARRFELFLQANVPAKDRYAGGVYGLIDKSGSALDMSMVAMMKIGGFTLDETKEILESWPHGSAQGREQGDRYWQRMWDRSSTPLNPPKAEVNAQATRYALKTVAELKALPPASWRVKGILPERGLASIYGPSGSGKTFVVLDLGISISIGRVWFRHKTAACPVTYVALEGSFGITNRLKAWEQYHGESITNNFRVVTDHLSLFHDGDIEEFAGVLLENGAEGGVVFIDTLNQSAPEADENTSKDMGRIISRAMRLQELTNSLVVLVHHTGKDAGKGLRGHSSLHAALDAAIEVKNDAKSRVWSLSKNKDGVDGIPNSFRLEIVKLGKDADGEEITSCVVLPDSHAVFKAAPKKPKGANQTIALKEINRLIRAVPAQPRSGSIKINTEDAIAAIGDALTCPDKRKRERAQTAINGLVAADIISQKDSQLWLS